MKVMLNGQERQIAEGHRSLSMLLAELEIDPRKVAIERNLEIVPRMQHSSTLLSEGDRIEIVQFIGGG